MKKKIIILASIIIPVFLIIILFFSYKSIVLTVDIVSPGNAVVIDNPIKGRSISLYEEEYTTLKIGVKNFFNTKVYPIIDNKDIIDYDEKSNMIIAKKEGEASIYFQTLFGISKSEKINITVDSLEMKEYEESVDKTNKKYKISSINSFESIPSVKFLSNDNLGKINEITLDDKKIDIDNFVLDGRTYIDINDYCNKIDCKITKEDNTLYIEKEIMNVKFLITHEIKSDKFKTTIINGNQKLDYDIGSTNIDAKSCPKNGLECDDSTIYLPLRFLMQAFGYTVTWEQSTNNVAINNYLYEEFDNDYKIMITNELKNKDDIIEDNSSLKKDEQLYMYVTDKDNKILDYQVVLSFSSDVENGATTDNIFEIKGNNIKLLDSSKIDDSKIKILVIKKIDSEVDESMYGLFPILIDFDVNNFSKVTGDDLGTITEADGSDGYKQTYTRNGITFKEYGQSWPPYNSAPYWGGTIGYKGCGPTSVAIICSGYSDENPKTVAAYMDKAYGYTYYGPLSGTLEHYGFKTEVVNYSQGNEEQKKKLQDHLLNGGYALVSNCTPAAGGDCVNSPSKDFASTSHILAILNIDPNNLDSIYISNPARTKRTGWQSLDYLLKHVRDSSYYILVSR